MYTVTTSREYGANNYVHVFGSAKSAREFAKNLEYNHGLRVMYITNANTGKEIPFRHNPLAK